MNKHVKQQVKKNEDEKKLNRRMSDVTRPYSDELVKAWDVVVIPALQIIVTGISNCKS